MPMKIATVDILVDKAHFDPQVAVAVAQAIDVAMDDKMQDWQRVTEPAMIQAKSELLSRTDGLGSDLRGEIRALAAELRGEMHGVKADILRHMYAAVLGQLALLLGMSYFFVLHVK